MNELSTFHTARRRVKGIIHVSTMQGRSTFFQIKTEIKIHNFVSEVQTDTLVDNGENNGYYKRAYS